MSASMPRKGARGLATYACLDRLTRKMAVAVRLTASRSAGEQRAPSLAMPHREALAGWPALALFCPGYEDRVRPGLLSQDRPIN